MQPELASLSFLPTASPPPLHLQRALLIFRAGAASRGGCSRAQNPRIDSSFSGRQLTEKLHYFTTPLPCFLWDGSVAGCPPPPFAPRLLADGFDQEPHVAPPCCHPSILPLPYREAEALGGGEAWRPRITFPLQGDPAGSGEGARKLFKLFPSFLNSHS